jgi:oligopeptidase B
VLQEVRAVMAGYSPVLNTCAGSYPPLLLTAGLHDKRVDFWQPARCVRCARRLVATHRRACCRAV